jgi:hypothetical protein
MASHLQQFAEFQMHPNETAPARFGKYVKKLMLRLHYLADADLMSFLEFFWLNWELSAGYV